MGYKFQFITLAGFHAQNHAIFDLAKKYDYRVFSIIVENRHGSTNLHGVPDDTLKKMKDRFHISL